MAHRLITPCFRCLALGTNETITMLAVTWPVRPGQVTTRGCTDGVRGYRCPAASSGILRRCGEHITSGLLQETVVYRTPKQQPYWTPGNAWSRPLLRTSGTRSLQSVSKPSRACQYIVTRRVSPACEVWAFGSYPANLIPSPKLKPPELLGLLGFADKKTPGSKPGVPELRVPSLDYCAGVHLR